MHTMLKEILIWTFGLVLVGLVAYGFAQQKQMVTRYDELQQTELEIERMKEEIGVLEKQVEAARRQVQSLVDDPTEIEAAIRQERQLTRSGETVFRVEEQPVQGQAVQVSAPQPMEIESIDESLAPVPVH